MAHYDDVAALPQGFHQRFPAQGLRMHRARQQHYSYHACLHENLLARVGQTTDH
jgi:hypothetical protein